MFGLRWKLPIAACCFVALALPLHAAEPPRMPTNRAPPLLAPPGASPTAAPPPIASLPTSAPPRASEPSEVERSAEEGFTPAPEFQAWISELVRRELPHQYEKRKNWGHTTRSLDGVSIQLDRGKLKTHRKYKQANDGKWQMYRITLLDPEEQFTVRVADIRQVEDGRVRMKITVDARMDVFGRQAVWEHGVQLFSVSADAEARVRLTATADVATRLDVTRLPPDVYLAPEVTAAKLDILSFKLRRISDLSGPLVRSLSDSVRAALEEKLAEDNPKLVAKLNKSIDKNENKLKLSAADLLESKWAGLLGNAAAAGSAPQPAVEPAP